MLQGMTRLTIDVDPGLHRQAKAKAATEGRTLAEVVRDALIAYVGDRGFGAGPPIPARLEEISIVRTDAAPGTMDDHGAWGIEPPDAPVVDPLTGSTFKVTESHMDGDVRVIEKVELESATHPVSRDTTERYPPKTKPKPRADLSKAAQAKGKMGR